ncbi:hypothetical protein LJC35_06000, partial [Parabacteroides sp. OttesenSCG-928-N08]|nr:hypothetical protein [Parabacteroides sp. OttesenSCG-928-N08]
MENPADSLPQPTRQLDEQLRDIRIRLRRSMNGVVSSAMREKGLHYKLNFGVTIPQLKEMAKSLPMDAL